MKTLGLIGGTTWVSTIDYYKLINQQVNKKVGGNSSAKILLYSVNFAEFNPPTDPNDWGELTQKFLDIAKTLENGGADCVVFCANTPHIIADKIQEHLKIPIINIAEETSKIVAKNQIKKVGLLGTRVTMEQPFYTNKLNDRGISVIIPELEDREFIHRSILDEMANDIFKQETKERYLRIIKDLVAKEIDGLILGCTEIPLLIKKEDVSIPMFDTTEIHVTAIVDFALSDE